MRDDVVQFPGDAQPLVRDALANAGAVLGVLGGIGHVGLALFYLFALPLAGGDRAEMVAYVERVNASPVLSLVAFPLILCFGLSMIVLPWAAWREGRIGTWGPALATAAVLVHFGLPFQPPAALSGLLLTALTAVFGYLGGSVLRMTQAEWDGSRSVPTGGLRPGLAAGRSA